jgi:hypothetical protein
MEHIVKNLDLLATLRLEIETRQEQLQKDIDKIYTPRIREKVAALQKEHEDANAELLAEIANLENTIRKDTIDNKETVKGEQLMAVYNKPRVSWDSKGLDGYMVAHPEVKVFRSEGDPSITIRKRN